MTPDIVQLIASLKIAQTPAEMAKITIKLLRECGIWNPQRVAQEIARMRVTNSVIGG